MSAYRVSQKGFTLIELIIVVAIIGIIAAFALPTYKDYTTRTRVSEGLVLASIAKIAVTETYAATGAWPEDNFAAGLDKTENIAGKNVASVEVGKEGIITVVYSLAEVQAGEGAEKTNGTIILSPIANGKGSVSWTCTGGTVPAQFRPAECRAPAVAVVPGGSK